MLVDDLQAYAALHHPELAKALPNAVKLVLSPEAAAAAATVASSNPSSILKALPLCRLPYRDIWIEWAHRDRHAVFGANSAIDDYRASMGLPAHVPTRMGVLINGTSDLQAGVMTFAWIIRTSGVNVCTMSVSYALDGRFLPDPFHLYVEETPESVRDTDLSIDPALRSNLTNRADLEAVVRINKAFSFVPTPFMMRQWVAASPDMKNHMLQTGMADLYGEPKYIIAILALLNSTSSTQIVDGEDFTRLNKKRIASGKLPLFEHKVLKLHLTKTQTERLRHAGVSPAHYRAHLVRGHFKVRRTGVYWWMPFLRGDIANGFVSKEYNVEG